MENDLVDERVGDIFRRLDGLEWPLVADYVFKYFRTAYFDGYLDGLADEHPLTEEVPMLRYPQLFLP